MSYLTITVCFLQQLPQTEGTHDEVSSDHEDDPYNEGNLTPMSIKNNKTY